MRPRLLIAGRAVRDAGHAVARDRRRRSSVIADATPGARVRHTRDVSHLVVGVGDVRRAVDEIFGPAPHVERGRRGLSVAKGVPFGAP